MLIPTLISAHRFRAARRAKHARAEARRTLAEREAAPVTDPINTLPSTRHPAFHRALEHVRSQMARAFEEIAELTDAEVQHLPSAYTGKRAHARVVLLRDLHEAYTLMREAVPRTGLDPILRGYRRMLKYCIYGCRYEFARALGHDVRTASQPEVVDGPKRCPGCNESKPRTEFHRSLTRHDGCQSYCKACMRARTLREPIEANAPRYRRTAAEIAADEAERRQMQAHGFTRQAIAKAMRDRTARRRAKLANPNT